MKQLPPSPSLEGIVLCRYSPHVDCMFWADLAGWRQTGCELGQRSWGTLHWGCLGGMARVRKGVSLGSWCMPWWVSLGEIAGAGMGMGRRTQGMFCQGCLWGMAVAGVGQGPVALWGSLDKLARMPGLCSHWCYQGGGGMQKMQHLQPWREFQQFPAHLADALGIVNGFPSHIV